MVAVRGVCLKSWLAQWKTRARRRYFGKSRVASGDGILRRRHRCVWENVFVKHLLQAAAAFTSRYHSVLSQPRDNGEAFVASSVQIIVARLIGF